MTLVGCCFTPHPPIIVPEVGGDRALPVADTIRAMERLGERFQALAPEVIVLLSPHAALSYDRMTVGVAGVYEGSLASFGAPGVRTHLEGDQPLAEAILRETLAAGVPVGPLGSQGSSLGLDHGCLVPLSFLLARDGEQEAGPTRPRLVLLNFSALDREAHLDFGLAISTAVDSSPARIAYVGSGDLSHRLTPEAPAGYDPQGAEFDRLVVEAFRSGEPGALLAIPVGLQERAGECGYRSLLVLLALLRYRGAKTEVLSYQGPFGVGYLVGGVELPQHQTGGPG